MEPEKKTLEEEKKPAPTPEFDTALSGDFCYKTCKNRVE